MITPSHHEIELLAYHKWLRRGEPFGSPEEDWRNAETELAQADELTLSDIARKIGAAVGGVVGLLQTTAQ